MEPDDQRTRRTGPGETTTAGRWHAGQRVFGRFALEKLVGRGGMGVVWSAQDEELDERVALKFLPDAVASDPAAVDELRRETRQARRLTHPNIVRIHDFFRDDFTAALAMELVDGVTLTQLRLEQPGRVFAVERLAPFVTQLCAALDYAHADAKIVHRDLKPANVLVTHDGKVRVTDFGIARSLAETATRLTGKGGDSAGTLPYMSPQQVLGQKPTAADDIYSLGALLYELLTSKPPFFRGEAYALTMQIREVAVTALALRRGELEIPVAPVPAAWEETILACLAKEPGERPKTLGEIADRLKSSAAASPVASASARLAPPGGRPTSRTLPPPRKPRAERTSSPFGAKRGGFLVCVFPPKAKAVVSLGHVSEMPVVDGEAIVRDLFDNDCELVVRAPGYVTHRSRVIVRDGGGVATVELAPHEAGGIRVEALPMTVVSRIAPDGRESILGTTNGEGRWQSEDDLEPGDYVLRFFNVACETTTTGSTKVTRETTTVFRPTQVPYSADLSVVFRADEAVGDASAAKRAAENAPPTASTGDTLQTAQTPPECSSRINVVGVWLFILLVVVPLALGLLWSLWKKT